MLYTDMINLKENSTLYYNLNALRIISTKFRDFSKILPNIYCIHLKVKLYVLCKEATYMYAKTNV